MDTKIVVALIALAVLATTLLRHRRAVALPFTLALFITVVWTSYYRYEYVGGNIFLFNQINLYPLIIGTTCLTQLYIIYRHMPKPYRVLLTSAMYLALLGLFEAVAYHLLGIRLTSNFTSLLDLGVIHAPRFMKAVYLLVGPGYILTLHVLEKRSGALRSR